MAHDTIKATGHGWAVTLHADGSLSARNAERGEAIELTADEVRAFRAIFAMVDALQPEASR